MALVRAPHHAPSDPTITHFFHTLAIVTFDKPISAPSSRDDQCVTPRRSDGASKVRRTIATSSICCGRPALDSATAGVLATDGAGWLRKSYAQLRTTLGLVVGSDVQAFDADLSALAGLPGAQGDVLYRDATQWQRLPKGAPVRCCGSTRH